MIAYKDLSGKIEKICQWFHYALLGSLIGIVAFPLIHTAVNYFILNMGMESFYLYPPTKFVSKKK